MSTFSAGTLAATVVNRHNIAVFSGLSVTAEESRQPLGQLRPWVVLGFGLLLATVSHVFPDTTEPFTATIHGATRAQEEQIRAHIRTAGWDEANDKNLQLQALGQTASTSLQALGYYSAKVSASHAAYQQNNAIQLVVDAGRPTVIEDIELNITGDAEDSNEFRKIIPTLPIRRGQRLDHGNYERAKDMLYSHARNLGFFNAKFLKSQVLVRKKEHGAKIFIEFDSGARHTIESVTYNTELFDKEFLTQWQPFKAGAPYRASHTAKLTRNLQNSGYFKYVSVKPQINQSADNAIPLLVDLTPARENIMSLGVGYATDTELRVKGTWLRPHHNAKGHALKGNTSISRLRQEVSVSYQMPHRKQPDNGRYTLDVGLLNHQSGDTFSQLRTMNISDSRLIGKGWYRDIFIRLENENTEDSKDRTNLLLPGFSFSRTLSDGGIHPDNGSFVALKAFGGSTRVFSDINMLRITASAKRLFSFRKKHYLITRAELGYLNATDFSRVAPSHRFFTGGDNSVRGFAFQSISPLNETDEAIGGRYLTNASVEYNYYFRDRWAFAAFADAGRAFSDTADPYSVGIGAGVRWLSPVGPLRIDIGVGVSEEDNPVRMHLAIGPQL